MKPGVYCSPDGTSLMLASLFDSKCRTLHLVFIEANNVFEGQVFNEAWQKLLFSSWIWLGSLE